MSFDQYPTFRTLDPEPAQETALRAFGDITVGIAGNTRPFRWDVTVGTACNDGNGCTTADACSAGACCGAGTGFDPWGDPDLGTGTWRSTTDAENAACVADVQAACNAPPPPPPAGYDCVVNNPCTPENAAAGLFYFESSIDPADFVQCSEFGQCYEFSCAPGVWSHAALNCL